uniref:Inhibitor_I29 domain-containing protein n=1 Tax=Macrostomum lignano TaxID=282301 RepID=A0A1I8GB00_9PLAT
MAWISFGLVLISMFTAGITVINGSYEQIFVYELGSTPVLISDWRSLLRSNFTEDKESEARHHGALIEHYMYLHLREEHQDRMNRIKPQYVLKRPSLRGMYSNLGTEVNSCLAATILREQINVYRRIVGHTHGADQAGQSSEVAEEVAQSLFSTSNAALGIVAGIFLAIFLALLIWEKVYWKPRNPNYKFVERNWKYDRQKKEAEFGRQLDLKSYYRQHNRKCGVEGGGGGGGGVGGGSAATTPTAGGQSGGSGGCSMSRPITIETLHAATLDEASVGGGATEAPGNNGSGIINNRRL